MELPPVKIQPPERVFHWLRLGWQDLRQVGGPSLLHGLIVTLVSIIIIGLTLLRWELIMIAASCFLITGPFLATGLYALSRDLEHHDQPLMSHATFAWRHASKCLFRFGLLLVLVCCLWVALSLSLFYLFVDVRIEDPADFLRYVLTQHDGLFLLWNILGSLVAALVFAITVVAMPLMVHRDVSTWFAVRASIRAVSENPFTMVWWAIVVVLLTGLSFATLMLGFIVLYPLLGHASWHVYRDLLDTENLPKHAAPE